MTLEGRRQQDYVSVREPVPEVQLLVPPKHQVQVETFDGRVPEGSHETRVRGVVYFEAEFLVLLEDVRPHGRDVGHV